VHLFRVAHLASDCLNKRREPPSSDACLCLSAHGQRYDDQVQAARLPRRGELPAELVIDSCHGLASRLTPPHQRSVPVGRPRSRREVAGLGRGRGGGGRGCRGGLAVTVCHFPPGTSKWNKIEHRLFSHITMNWRGRPLTSHEVIVNTIAATRTRTGLTVRAELDPGRYPDGVKVSDEQMDCLPLDKHDWHGDWNYTLRPEPSAPLPPPRPPAREPERPGWAHPALTGLSAAQWDQLIAALSTPYQAQREAALYIARGGPPTRKPAGGHPPALSLAEQVLVTILRQRFGTPQHVLAELFGVVTGTIARAERQARPPLEQHGHQTKPAPAPVKTLAELTAYATAHGIELIPKAKPAC
jgi:hypothetical protein